MQTTAITTHELSESVIAVPPLARDQHEIPNDTENAKIIRHIESGGVRTILYGGNANFYHVRLNEYAELLEFFTRTVGDDTRVIPSVGPTYGLSMDQAALLSQARFPTAMVLPPSGMFTEAGLMTGFRKVVETFGRSCVLYIKNEDMLSPGAVAKLVADGLVSFVKYSIVADDPTEDEYLKDLVSIVDRGLIVSGTGEQPVVAHVAGFGLNGFTTGCGTINPRLSMEMLAAVQTKDLERCARIIEAFRPLEELRNEISPMRVLHEAVGLAGIADPGEVLPLMSGLADAERVRVREVVEALLRA